MTHVRTARGQTSNIDGSDVLSVDRAVERGGSKDGAAQALARSALVPAAVSLLVYGLQPAAAEGDPQVLSLGCGIARPTTAVTFDTLCEPRACQCLEGCHLADVCLSGMLLYVQTWLDWSQAPSPCFMSADDERGHRVRAHVPVAQLRGAAGCGL